MDNESHFEYVSSPELVRKCIRFEDKRVTEAEGFNNLLAQHLPGEVINWECDALGWTFELADAIVEVSNIVDEPIAVKASSNTIPRRYLDPLRDELRCLLRQSLDADCGTIAFAVLLIRLVEEAVIWIHLWRGEVARRKQNIAFTRAKASEFIELYGEDANTAELLRLAARQDEILPDQFRAEHVVSWYSVLDHASGLDLSSVEDTAKHLLGKSIAKICEDITHPTGRYYGDRVLNDDIRILHVEPVFRPNLVARFLKRKLEIHQELLEMSYRDLRKSVHRNIIRPNSREDTVDGLARVLAEPSVTFHGAPRHAMQSIVRYGFIVPGGDIGRTGKALDIAHGATYGIGIYSSPDPYFAMDYASWNDGAVGAERSAAFKSRDTPGQRLIVCATLMGRAATVTRDETRRTTGKFVCAAHSHVSVDQKQYAVFDSSQIIPCYVIHLDQHPDLRDEDSMRQHTTHGRLSQYALRSPGESESKKAAIKASAMKWFPNGFGPATGTSFVIEDMAEVSDDEEVYGEFQHQRIEQQHEVREQYHAPGASWLDQYQTVRKTKTDTVEAL